MPTTEEIADERAGLSCAPLSSLRKICRCTGVLTASRIRGRSSISYALSFSRSRMRLTCDSMPDSTKIEEEVLA